MDQTFSSLLAAWSNFYVMTGTSAAGLTGLMFVVITLVTGAEKARSQDGISTFSTPTVMHFGAALFVSAVLIAPFRSVAIAATLVGFAGLYGVVYILRVTYRAKRLQGYRPDIEDWTWYNALPFLAYGAILAGAIALHAVPWEGAPCRRRRRAAADLHRNSQRLGRRHVPRDRRPRIAVRWSHP